MQAAGVAFNLKANYSHYYTALIATAQNENQHYLLQCFGFMKTVAAS